MRVGGSLGVAPWQMFASLARNGELVFNLVRRDVLGRYRGSVLGITWSFVTPLLMLGVYTFFFSFVLKARWGVQEGQGHADFATVLFVGLIIHGLFTECLVKAPTLVSANVTYVKKIIFPLEIFPWVAAGSAAFHALVSVVVLLLLLVLTHNPVHWTVVLFPLVTAPLVLMILGVSWFLAAVGVFVRDVSQVTALLASVLLFLSPIFYPLSILPEQLRQVALLNPLSLIIEESRKVLLYGVLPDLSALISYAGVALLVAWGGFWFFQRSRRWFADVL